MPDYFSASSIREFTIGTWINRNYPYQHYNFYYDDSGWYLKVINIKNQQTILFNLNNRIIIDDYYLFRDDTQITDWSFAIKKSQELNPDFLELYKVDSLAINTRENIPLVRVSD